MLIIIKTTNIGVLLILIVTNYEADAWNNFVCYILYERNKTYLHSSTLYIIFNIIKYYDSKLAIKPIVVDINILVQGMCVNKNFGSVLVADNNRNRSRCRWHITKQAVFTLTSHWLIMMINTLTTLKGVHIIV